MKQLICLLSIFSFISLANATSFNQINNFRNKDCPTWNLDRFERLDTYITFGVEGAKDYGYDFEFPIDRKGVDAIWCALVPDRGRENKSCHGTRVDLSSPRPFHRYSGQRALETKSFPTFNDLEEQYDAYLAYVRKAVRVEKIKHPNVGAVLELLSRYYLQVLTDMYPSHIYGIASGVEYRHSRGENTLGELDIIIYERDTCDVIVLGESKASSPKNQNRSLRKAKNQLNRFREFLRRHL